MATTENPSIALIPSGYKAGKVYSVLPTDGAGDLTFTRVGALPSFNATRVNEDGLIEEVLSNVPRLDYSGGGCPSLLLEPQRINLLSYSEEFDNGAWSKTRSSIDANQIISPSGILNADKFIENTDNNSHLLSRTTSVTAQNYVSSVFIKKGERKKVRLRFDNTLTLRYAEFDLENGVVDLENNSIASIENYGNGWYRCSIKVTATATTFFTVIQLLSDNGDLNYQGDGTSGLYIWGAQLEASSYATSYIPTTSATVTRVAESFTKTGLSNYINSQEGVLFVEMAALVNSETGSNRAITINGIGGSVTDLITIRFEPSLNQIVAIFAKTGETTLSIYRTITDVTDFNKIAFSWKQNEFNLWNNGVKIGSLTSGNTFSAGILDAINSNIGNGAQPYRGEIKDLRVYSTALTDQELQQLTSL